MSEARLLDVGKSVLRELIKEFNEVAVLMLSRESVMVKITNNEPSSIQSWKLHVINLYLTKDRRVFEVGVSVPKPEDAVRVVNELSSYTHLVRESEIYAPLPEPQDVKPLDNLLDHNVLTYMSNPTRITELMINSAVNEGAERVAGTLELGITTKALLTSKGFEGIERGSSVMAYLRAFKGSFSGHWAFGSRFINLEAIEDVGRRAALYAAATNVERRIEPGKYDVILSPLVVGNLFDLIASMASAFAVISGFSIFMNRKLGERVAADSLTLIDAPRVSELSNSTAFDDEGVGTYDKELIGNGELKSLLHNVKTASKMGASTTGNAGWIEPRPWNIVIQPGDVSEGEMIRDVRRGLLITNNWYTRLQNYVEGMFSTVSRDATLVIENGEVVGNAGRVRIADNLNRLLNNIRYVGNEQYLIRWWEVRTPSKVPFILVNDVNITKPFE